MAGNPVEMLVTGAEGVEVSAVTVPACRETSVESIRETLALRRNLAQPSAEITTLRADLAASQADLAALRGLRNVRHIDDDQRAANARVGLTDELFRQFRKEE